MQQEIRFATFNVCNLAAAGAKLYDNLEPLSPAQYEAKAEWTARQIDLLDADVIGFQEVFSQAALRDVLSRTRHYREAAQAGYDAMDAAGRMLPTVALVSRLPLAGPGIAFANFPAGVMLPAGSHAADDHPCRFARAPLHVQVILHIEHLRAAAQHDAAHRRDIAEIAPPAQRDVFVLDQAAVGGIEIDPAEHRAPDRHPRVRGVGQQTLDVQVTVTPLPL